MKTVDDVIDELYNSGNHNMADYPIGFNYEFLINCMYEYASQFKEDNAEKLSRQLYVGMVAEIIGFEKNLELLKEANNTFKSKK